MWQVIAGLALDKMKQNGQDDINEQQQAIANRNNMRQSILQKRDARQQAQSAVGAQNGHINIGALVDGVFTGNKKNNGVPSGFFGGV